MRQMRQKKQTRQKNLLAKILLTTMGLFLCLLFAPADKVYAWDYYVQEGDTYGGHTFDDGDADEVDLYIERWVDNNRADWSNAYGYTPSLLYDDGDLVGEVDDDDYVIGSDCPADSTRYMLEWQTDSETCPDYDMYCSIVYTDSMGYIRWLEPFDFRSEWQDYKKEEDLFYKDEKVFYYGELGYLEVTLPDCRDVLGVYLANWSDSAHDSEPWGFSYFTIAKVDTSSTPQESAFRDITYNGKTIHTEQLDYTGTYVGSIADDHDYLQITIWGKSPWDACLYMFQTPKMNGISQNPAVTREVDNTYYLHMVAENMYRFNINFDITINYTDVMGITRNRRIDFDSITMRPDYKDKYCVTVPGDTFLSYINMRTAWSNKYASDFVYNRELERLFNGNFYKTGYAMVTRDIAKKYIGNYPKDEAFCAKIHPYAASDWEFNLYGGATKINSITITTGSTPVKLQTIAVCRQDESLYKSLPKDQLFFDGVMNGGISGQPNISWAGICLARNAEAVSVANASLTLSPGGVGSNKLILDGATPYYAAFSKIGINLQLADNKDAGINSYLHSGKSTSGNSYSADWNASFPTQYAEALTLEVVYLDIFDNTRKVEIPFITAYQLQLMDDMAHSDYKNAFRFLGGILQGGDEAAIILPLFEYKELVSLTFTYGQAPSDFNTPDNKVDASDILAVRSIEIYDHLLSSDTFKMQRSGQYGLMLQTNRQATMHYESPNTDGYQFGQGSSLTLTTGDDGNLTSGPFLSSKDYVGAYLVQVESEGNLIPTTDESFYRITYTDKSGEQVTTAQASVKDAMLNYYGYRINDMTKSNSVADIMKNPVKFIVYLPDAATFDSIEFTSGTLTPGWQINSVSIHSLNLLFKREAYLTNDGDFFRFKRNWSGKEVAKVYYPMLLNYANGTTGTFYFTTVDKDGNEIVPERKPTTDTSQYLVNLPYTMTYEETQRNLGLTITKASYRVDVKVADTVDAGSNNYFYFQLEFADGNTSGVVLANQQLAADGFRQGTTESFTISTTQNYGAVTGVRIICDSTSSTSTVFDKLNIDSISVTLSNSNGLGKSWIVDRVGWIDINYQDEGATESGSGDKELQLTNEEISKSFPVNRVVSSMDFLFTITNSNNVLRRLAANGALKAELTYIDTTGTAIPIMIDLSKALNEYAPAENSSSNQVERFTVTLNNIKSFQNIKLIRTDTGSAETIGDISISQVSELGKVLYKDGGYYRQPASETVITKTNATNGIKLEPKNSVTYAFEENNVETILDSNDGTKWSSTITTNTTTAPSTINLYIYPGTVAGKGGSFASNTAPMNVYINYTNTYGKESVSTFQVSNWCMSGGVTAMAKTNISLTNLATINKLTVTSSTSSSNQPVIGSAKIERVTGNVIVDTRHFSFSGGDLSRAATGYEDSESVYSQPMMQTVRLRLAPDQDITLIPKTKDVAIALLYTSELEDADNKKKTAYQTTYKYLTDEYYINLKDNLNLEIPFEAQGVGELAGLVVQSTGDVVRFESAIITNFQKKADGTRGGKLSSCSIATPFVANAAASTVNNIKSGDIVSDVEITFTTPTDTLVQGAGTSGKVTLELTYMDIDGIEQTKTIEKLLNLFEEGKLPTPGSTVTLKLLLPNAAYLENAVIKTESDAWYLEKMTATVTDPFGDVTTSSTYVNNWADIDAPLTVNLLPDSMKGGNSVNQVTGLALTGVISGPQRETDTTFSNEGNNIVYQMVYPGETVTLTPNVIYQGEPDTSVSWVYKGFEDYVGIENGVLTFTVPSNAKENQIYNVAVHCNGNQGLSIRVQLGVIPLPVIPTPTPNPTPVLPDDTANPVQIVVRQTSSTGATSDLLSKFYTTADTITVNAHQGDSLTLITAMSAMYGGTGFSYWNQEDANKPTQITLNIPADAAIGSYYNYEAVFEDGAGGTNNFTLKLFIKVTEVSTDADGTKTSPSPSPTPTP